MNVFDDLHACVAGRNAASRRAWFVPGRIEVLGKHTDYAGGRSLVCAIDRGFRVVAAPRDDSVITLTDRGQQVDATLEMSPALPQAQGHWSSYPRVVVRRLARHFPAARRGADIAFSSNLPPAAGISSSTAFLIAFYLVLAAVNELDRDETYRQAIASREDLADFLAAIESGYSYGPFPGDHGVGISGGSQDHTAILCCERDRLAVYSWNPARHERSIDLDPALRFVIGASGVVAEKAGAARDGYNRASLAASRILAIWNEATGRTDRSLATAATSEPGAADHIRALIRERGGDDYLPGRFEQFFEESLQIVPGAAEALARRDYGAFGTLVDRSQSLVERLLGNQVAQTIDLAASARQLGALAASAFGGGFGGSVWALVHERDSDAFMRRWQAAYLQKYPECASRATFFATGAGRAAIEIRGAEGC